MKPEILSLLEVSSPYRERLEATFTLHVLTDFSPKNGDLLPATMRNVRGLITTGGRLGASADMMDAMPDLEIIACHSVGYNAVDVEAARRRGILVTNAPDALSDDVGEYAVAMMLAASRRLVEADRFLRAGRWQPGRWSADDIGHGRSLKGRIVGIFGMGGIGGRVAEMAEAIGMVPIYHNRRPVPGSAFRYCPDLLDMARDSDVLVVAAIGSAETRGRVDREVLDALGPNGLLVNVARGLIVDEPALVSALQDGRLGAAAIDVFVDEPNVPSVLLEMDNVVLSPHYAAGTPTAGGALARLAVENLEAHFAGRPAPHPVDDGVG